MTDPNQAFAQLVRIPLPHGGFYCGDFAMPAVVRGVVVLPRASGSSRYTPEHRSVASALRRSGLATLLLDLLSEAEEAEERTGARKRYDVSELAGRLLLATDELACFPHARAAPVGYFGSGTGTAAALVAAAIRPQRVRAIASRSGEPQLVPKDLLARVKAPTLLIVAERDPEAVQSNCRVFEQLRAERSLRIIPRVSRSFEEPGALDQVAACAADWFLTHFFDSCGP